MTTMTTREPRVAVLWEHLGDMLRHALETLAPAAPTEPEEDIDWEDGEPEDEAEHAA